MMKVESYNLKNGVFLFYFTLTDWIFQWFLPCDWLMKIRRLHVINTFINTEALTKSNFNYESASDGKT